MSIFFRFIIAFMCGLALIGQAGAERIPSMGDGAIQDFLRNVAAGTRFSGAKLSPSGRYLIYIAHDSRAYGGDTAVLFDLDAEGGMAGRRVQVGARSIDWVAWASDDQFLISISTRYSGRVRLSLDRNRVVASSDPSRILSINRETLQRSAVLLEEQASNFGNWDLTQISDMLPDDPDHILMPAYGRRGYDLFRVNILTGESERIEEGTRATVGWYAADGDPVLRVDRTRRGGSLIFYARTGSGDEWRRITSIRTRDLFRGRPDFEWAGPSNVPGQIFVRARPGGSQFFGIYPYDLASGEYLEPVALLPDMDVEEALLDQTGRYFGYAYGDERLRYHFADEGFNRRFRAIETFLGEDLVLRPISFGGNRMLVFASGPTEPGVYYIFDRTDNSIEPILAVNPDLLMDDLRPMRPITYSARDGVEVHGYLTVPRTGATSATPLIVMPHGGPELRDTLGFDPVVQYLTALGYSVLQPNFRGSMGYGRDFAESGYRQWGRAMQDDITDGVHWVIAEGLANPDQVCIVGFSYGGYAALAGAALTPDLYRCAVAGAPVTDLRRFLEFKRDYGEEVYDYWVALLGNPRADRASMDAVSPVHLADRISIPVYLFHGPEDELVPVEQSQQMAAALERAGAQYRYLEDPAIGHDLGEKLDFINTMHNLGEFLNDAMDGSLDTFEPEIRDDGFE